MTREWSQRGKNKVWNFLKFWGIAIALWVGVGYELYVLWPKILIALHTYL